MTTTDTTTIYPSFDKRLTEKTLHRLFSPDAADLAFAGIKPDTRFKASKAYLLVVLKCAQYLCYVPQANQIPLYVARFVVKSIYPRYLARHDELAQYLKSGTLKRQLPRIRSYLGFTGSPLETRDNAMRYAESAASTKVRFLDVLNACIEGVILDGHELPALSTLQKIAKAAMTSAQKILFDQVVSQLTPDMKDEIDEILAFVGPSQKSTWQRFKESGDLPKKLVLKEYLVSFDTLDDLVSRLPSLSSVGPDRKEQLASEALALDSWNMRRLPSEKRYMLAMILIDYRWTEGLDQLTTLLVKTMQEIESAALRVYTAGVMKRGKETTALVSTLHDILCHWSAADGKDQKYEYLNSIFELKGEDLIQACQQHLTNHGEGHRPTIVTLFNKKRSTLIEIIKRLPLDSDATCQSLIKFKQHILAFNRKTNVVKMHPHLYDLSWASRSWHNLAVTTDNLTYERHLHVRTIEAAWFSTIKKSLKSYHCYVTGATIYGNPDDYLVDWDQYDELLPTIVETTDLPASGKEFVSRLKNELKVHAKRIDETFPSIEGAYFKNDELILKKAHKPYTSKTLAPLQSAISEKMPKPSIVDVLSDTVRWLNLQHLFKPLSGHDTKLDDITLRVVLSLFCFGCNVGARQTANSVRNISEKQVSWLNSRYVDSAVLKRAIKKVINQYNKMALPKKWGTGKRAAPDGSLTQTFDANLMSEFHVRHFKRGLMGYYMISDKYIALFSHFITCGAHESWYLLDGVMNNDTDIKPDTIHGDTHQQSYALFGLAHLLGIELMPRIRGISSKPFFRPTPKAKYRNIDSIFKGHIRWELIAKAYPDMLRLVMSVQQGLLVPSVILRRLNSSNDTLALGLMELGKVVRTRFLLQVISDIELRRIQHRETNKTEQWHNFLDMITFGNNGTVRSNNPVDQEKMIQYQHLVSDLVILYNTHHMTKSINALRDEGYPIVDEDLAHISPYNLYGLRLIGDYRVDVQRELEPMEELLYG